MSRTLLVPIGALVLIAATPCLLAQAPAPASAERQVVRGQVFESLRGVPLRRARVSSPAGGQTEPTYTDDQGRFAIETVLPVTLRASKAGYAASIVTLSPGSEPEVRFTLVRGAAVIGRVSDGLGAPVVASYVTARLITTQPADRPVALRQFYVQTDPLGEYRLGGLPPGRYEVTAARVKPERRQSNVPLQEQLFGSPDALELAGQSLQVTLGSGDEMHDLNFTLPESSNMCPRGPSVRPGPGAVTATIRGRVAGPTGAPLACAIVRVITPDTSIPSVYTDDQGRYSIEGLSAGSFIVEAWQSNHIRLQYGQQRASDLETPVTLREGETRTRVDFALPRTSVISGTIVDEHGEPVEGITVSAAVSRYLSGRFTPMSPALPDSTDDRGQYRIVGLDPGTYVVRATVSGGLSAGSDERGQGYAAVYYPGTPDMSAALGVVVDVGRDAPGIDFTFTPTPTATVSGWAFDGAGRALEGTVSVLASGSRGIAANTFTARIEANGRFLVRNVPPGNYVVQAQGRSGGSPKFGVQYVRVADREPPPLMLIAAERATVEGRLTADDGSDASRWGVLVTAEPADPDISPAPGGALAMGDAGASSTLKDGAFRLVGVAGPSRLLVTTSSCEDCYVRSVLVSGSDATDRPFDFGLRGELFRDVHITVSDAGAGIEGRVSVSRDAPVLAFTVVVYPTNPDLWYPRSPHVKAQRSAQDGSFRVSALPPGEYFVAAVNRLDRVPFGGDLNNPEWLTEVASQGQRVSLRERDRRVVNLQLIRR